ncbi:MAG: hypothetical protein Q8L85_07745 [Alphaproteobacteria bacterium]|nr:hypothetical protein [Alphaproteobacteria bacterium]MDP3531988.1 hypothetical protein [Alphaproteobacteria bacterium]
MKKMIYILALVFVTGMPSFSNADPFVKNNLSIEQMNYGNASATSKIDSIDASFVQVGAAGNTINLSGNVENSVFFMQSYGNMIADAQVSNVSNSYIQVNAIGNSITFR